MAGTIDLTGMPALSEFVRRFSPAFPIGAMDPNQVPIFGNYGPMQHTFVPMIYFIDRTGMVRVQFHGADSFFAEHEARANLRAEILRLIGGPPAAAKPGAPPAKK